MKSLIIILFFITSIIVVLGQIQSPQTPTFGTFDNKNPSVSHTQSSSSQPKHSSNNIPKTQNINQTNKAMGFKNPTQQAEVKTNFYKDPLTIQKEQSEIEKIIVELDQMKVRDERINFNRENSSKLCFGV